MEQDSFTFDSQRRSYTVSEITAEIKGLLQKQFGTVRVEGEVSNLRVPASGHYYFTLKDEGAQIRCVMFKYQARLLRFKIEDGQKLMVKARVGVYEARGEYQLMLDHAEPLGVGELELAFRQLKERLAEEGLFDPSRKKPVPEIPRKVGIITSGTGAAIRDIIQTVTRRSKLVDLLLVPARVQGDGSAREIADAIALLDSGKNPWGQVDVIIIGRGGGSLEDLWAFNEEITARAVANCKTPLISAVGHETDFVITDFVADLRAPTPTAAAERVSPLQSEIRRRIDTHRSRMDNALTAYLRHASEQLAGLKRALPDLGRDMDDRALKLDDIIERLRHRLVENFASKSQQVNAMGRMLVRTPFAERIDRRMERIDRGKASLLAGVNSVFEEAGTGLNMSMLKLNSLNPLAVLKRGYAIVRKLPDERLITDSGQVSKNDRIEIKLHKGRIISAVEETES